MRKKRGKLIKIMLWLRRRDEVQVLIDLSQIEKENQNMSGHSKFANIKHKKEKRMMQQRKDFYKDRT